MVNKETQKNTFYKCIKYKIHNKLKKPLLFYHVPKCAGTTLTVMLSHLFKNQVRAMGPLFTNNDKGGETAYEFFQKNLKLINKSKINFLYGHLPFEVSEFLNNKYYKITTIRNPIDRAVSHYKWMLIRGFCNKKDKLKNLFNENKIPKNVIVNQFSGIGLKEQNTELSFNLAFKNINDNLDYVCKSDDLFYLLKYIISYYNLPNLVFQNYQVVNTDFNLSKEDLEVIEENNQLDIQLYSLLLEKNIFKIEKIKSSKVEIEQDYFYSSPLVKINNKNNLIINYIKLIDIQKKLESKKYIFKEF